MIRLIYCLPLLLLVFGGRTLSVDQQSMSAGTCPSSLPANVANSIKTPEVRATVAQMPRLTPATFEMFGGLDSMIALTRAQIVEYDNWIAKEQANRAFLDRQGAGRFEEIRRSEIALQAIRDGRTLTIETLKILECHARSGAGKGSKDPTRPQAGATGQTEESFVEGRCGKATGTPAYQKCATQAADEFRELTMAAAGITGGVSNAVKSAFGTGSNAIDKAVENLLSGVDAALANECQAVVSAGGVALAGNGTNVSFTLDVRHLHSQACTVSFSVDVRTGSTSLAGLPVRTAVVPAAGVRLTETVALAVPVQTSARACEAIEPTKQALLRKRDSLAIDIRKFQKAANDSRENLNRLQRAVGEYDYAQAFQLIPSTIDAVKGMFPPQFAAALGTGGCIGEEMATFAGLAATNCKADDVNGCVQSVLEDGASWTVKTVACAAQGTMETVSKLERINKLYEGYRTARDIAEIQRTKAAAIDILELALDNIRRCGERVQRLQRESTIINATIGPLEALCRSPRIDVAVGDLRSVPVK